MKSYKARDVCRLYDSVLVVVDRPDPWAPLAPGELPKPGEVVEIDGKQHATILTQLMEGSFGYKPHLAIKIPLDDEARPHFVRASSSGCIR